MGIYSSNAALQQGDEVLPLLGRDLLLEVVQHDHVVAPCADVLEHRGLALLGMGVGDGDIGMAGEGLREGLLVEAVPAGDDQHAQGFGLGGGFGIGAGGGKGGTKCQRDHYGRCHGKSGPCVHCSAPRIGE